jgi:hypothetical protein
MSYASSDRLSPVVKPSNLSLRTSLPVTLLNHSSGNSPLGVMHVKTTSRLHLDSWDLLITTDMLTATKREADAVVIVSVASIVGSILVQRILQRTTRGNTTLLSRLQHTGIDVTS